MLPEKGIIVSGFVSMPSHVHLVVYVKKDTKGLNKAIGDIKRFAAYEIVTPLKERIEFTPSSSKGCPRKRKIEKQTTPSFQTFYFIGVIPHQNYTAMARQSISFTEPNDEWLKAQVDNKEYSSKSEEVNDLIRQARNQQKQIDFIRAKIEKAEKSGFTSDSREDILRQAKEGLNG